MFLQELGGTAVDLGEIRRQALQSPGVNRSLLLITLERCFQLLGSLECVDVLGRVLRGSSASLLQPDITDRLPGGLGKDAFKNLWVTLPIALHPTHTIPGGLLGGFKERLRGSREAGGDRSGTEA